MTKEKSCISKEEYAEYGKTLSLLNDRLLINSIEISNQKGKTNPHARLLEKTIKALTELRSELEECCYKDFPNSNIPFFGVRVRGNSQ